MTVLSLATFNVQAIVAQFFAPAAGLMRLYVISDMSFIHQF